MKSRGWSSWPVETLSISGLNPMAVRQKFPYMTITSWGKSMMSGLSLHASFNLQLQQVWALWNSYDHLTISWIQAPKLRPSPSEYVIGGGLNHAPLIPAGFWSFLRNPEESILAQSPAKITFWGTNILAE